MNIGIIDSGEGGRSFYLSFKKRFPFFYYTVLLDKAFFPYGEKEHKILYNRGVELIDYLNKCDYIIIACNTLSIALKDYQNVKVIRITDKTIEYAKKYQNIGLMASKYTIQSNYYQNRLNIIWAYDASKEIKEIEESKFNLDIKIPKVDLLILGCTHFIKEKKAFRGLNILSQDELDFHDYWED